MVPACRYFPGSGMRTVTWLPGDLSSMPGTTSNIPVRRILSVSGVDSRCPWTRKLLQDGALSGFCGRFDRPVSKFWNHSMHFRRARTVYYPNMRQYAAYLSSASYTRRVAYVASSLEFYKNENPTANAGLAKYAHRNRNALSSSCGDIGPRQTLRSKPNVCNEGRTLQPLNVQLCFAMKTAMRFGVLRTVDSTLSWSLMLPSSLGRITCDLAILSPV